MSFDFNVSYSSCWGYYLINTLKFKKKIHRYNGWTRQRACSCPLSFVPADAQSSCVQNVGRTNSHPSLQAPVRWFFWTSEPGRALGAGRKDGDIHYTIADLFQWQYFGNKWPCCFVFEIVGMYKTSDFRHPSSGYPTVYSSTRKNISDWVARIYSSLPSCMQGLIILVETPGFNLLMQFAFSWLGFVSRPTYWIVWMQMLEAASHRHGKHLR